MKVIKISSISCPSCIIMDNIFNKIKDNYNFEYEQLDYDFDEEEVNKYNVESILPVYIFIENDKEIGRIVGEMNEKKFIEKIEQIYRKESI